MKAGPLALKINHQTYSPERVLDLWINGRYFHSERSKAAALDALDPTSTIFVRHLLMDTVVEVTRYAIFLANVILTCRREGVLQPD
ncbi:hypothetical protein KSP35_13220 [Aquihabitans sp. G128]|uniref:hypothetical protein n=1 Tax=Aquihabitans sp. G128 TaxID=2849779 RepID=UPI001C214BE0|nr:hypothetical protein [Aquihabitans sp. G128]QXC59364.1 hypothetical protein KSP35_13220 [Aquihabitans sp. G128]